MGGVPTPGRDAVISIVSPSGGGPSEVTEVTTAVISAMREARVRRLVAVSANGMVATQYADHREHRPPGCSAGRSPILSSRNERFNPASSTGLPGGCHRLRGYFGATEDRAARGPFHALDSSAVYDMRLTSAGMCV